jgi:hypothetical protein
MQEFVKLRYGRLPSFQANAKNLDNAERIKVQVAVMHAASTRGGITTTQGQ